MDPKWEFNANQFVDFNNLEDQDNSRADDFFEVNMETGERYFLTQLFDNNFKQDSCSRIEGEDEDDLGVGQVKEDIRETGHGHEDPKQSTSSENNQAKLGTPYIVVTSDDQKPRRPATDQPETSNGSTDQSEPGRRKPANLVTSWGPKEKQAFMKAKEKQAKTVGGGGSSSAAPRLPPKSDYVVRQQQSVTLSAGGTRPAAAAGN